MPSTTLPTYLHLLFWGDNLKELSWQKHQKYIIQTILERGNTKTISWLFSKINKNKLLQLLSKIKLTDKSANFWKTYLS